MPTPPKDLHKVLRVTKERMRDAIICRFFIPNFVFIPFFIFGWHTGPFILALLLRGWLQRSVEHHYANEWSYAYTLYYAKKLVNEKKVDQDD